MDEPHTHAEEKQAPQSTQTRRRQIVGDSDDDKPQPKRARLTRKNLAAFDKMGKKKTSDDDSGSTKTKSTTSSGFAEKAYKNGILPSFKSKPPKNLKDIRKRYAKSRATASPPESVYEHYVNRVEKAGTEATIVAETSRRLLKEYDDKGYKREFNRAFTNLPKDVGFNNNLSAPQPDFVEGLEKDEYCLLLIDEYVPGVAFYKDDPYSVTLPQIAGEWKGPAGDMRTARIQSAYDGAAMVYARTQALAYIGKSDPPNHALITTFSTNGTNLYQYAHYTAPSDKDPDTLEYHQFLISSIDLTSTYQGYKDGRKSLRNAQDYAKTQSEELRDQLKEYWEQRRDSPHPIAKVVPTLPVLGTKPLDTYENEDDNEDDNEVVEPQPIDQPTPPTTSKLKSSKTHSHHSHSTPHSSKVPSKTSHHAPINTRGGQKRKASSSQESSSSSSRRKYKSYWKKDAMSGRYNLRSHVSITSTWP